MRVMYVYADIFISTNAHIFITTNAQILTSTQIRIHTDAYRHFYIHTLKYVPGYRFSLTDTHTRKHK